MQIRMEEKHTAELTMRPVCECGHIFNELYYNHHTMRFYPPYCPDCKRIIETLRYNDITKCCCDEDGNICICE